MAEFPWRALEAAQKDVYHAPASRAGSIRSIQLPITSPLTKKCGAPMPPSKGLECTRRTIAKVRKQGPATMRDEKRPRSSRYAIHTQGPSRRFRSNSAAARGRRFYPTKCRCWRLYCSERHALRHDHLQSATPSSLHRLDARPEEPQSQKHEPPSPHRCPRRPIERQGRFN